jgi:DNA-binding transcriptional ArsR family regulator
MLKLSEKQLEILKLIKNAEKGLSYKEIVDSSGVSDVTVSSTIIKLQDLGLVTYERENRELGDPYTRRKPKGTKKTKAVRRVSRGVYRFVDLGESAIFLNETKQFMDFPGNLQLVDPKDDFSLFVQDSKEHLKHFSNGYSSAFKALMENKDFLTKIDELRGEIFRAYFNYMITKIPKADIGLITEFIDESIKQLCQDFPELDPLKDEENSIAKMGPPAELSFLQKCVMYDSMIAVFGEWRKDGYAERKINEGTERRKGMPIPKVMQDEKALELYLMFSEEILKVPKAVLLIDNGHARNAIPEVLEGLKSQGLYDGPIRQFSVFHPLMRKTIENLIHSREKELTET